MKIYVLWNLSVISHWIFPQCVFGLGLACQAKGHSNRIPTFQTLPRIYGNNRKKKNEEKCEPQLAKHINAFQKRPVETKIYFQLNMIVSFKFKRNTERYLILIVRNGLIETLRSDEFYHN